MSENENEAAYDPMAYYKEQQKQMLMQATQHVKDSHIEIQQAQADAIAADQTADSAVAEDTGRRSRHAAAAAKAAISMSMQDAGFEQRPVNRIEPTYRVVPHAAVGISPRGRGRPKGSLNRIRGGAKGGVTVAMTSTFGNPMREMQPEDESSLYFVVRNGKASLQQVIDDWIDCYKADRDGALLNLMQFFISASGCKGRISPNIQTMEHADIIRIMTEEFDEDSGEYPLVMTGLLAKKFRTNFCDFIQLLVKQCQYSIIYDQYLMDNVISLLTQLTDSQVRAFRHTATLAAMKLMTALVDIALTVSINLENTQRQYDGEQQKARNKRATDRLESLMTRRKELEENTDEIKNMLTYMFKSVFVHRYRDVVPEIRSICMSEIGEWMKRYHTNFLDDTYLKYIGWTIHDKVGDVRLKCLQALQPLYASEELKEKLELFTSKFKDRIVSMTLDKEYDVAVEAVRLVISILRYHREMLSDKDCEQVYELVYSSHRAVAQAAGEFLNENLFVPDDESNADIRSKRGKRRLVNTPLIRDLVQFFIESELHEHGAYLVDALIESNPMMKDWECMTDLLLEEAGPEEEALDDRQETSLIEFMVCCVRQAATGEPPVGRGSTRKTCSSKELKQVLDDKQCLTTHFIQTLPPLLRKYLPDHEKISNLLLIPQFFDLEIYTTSRQEKNLDALLSLMQEIVERHSDKEVLSACAKTLEMLCDSSCTIYSRCDVSKGRILDMISSVYNVAKDDYSNLLTGGELPTEDERFSLISSCKKIEYFYACHNMGPWHIWESLFQITHGYKEDLQGVSEELRFPLDSVKSSIAACCFGLIWEHYQIHHTALRDSTAQDVQILLDRIGRYMGCIQGLMREPTCPFSLRQECYVSICDLLVFFVRKRKLNQTSSNQSAPLASLYYKADDNLADLLNSFVQEKVFISHEEIDMETDADGEEDHHAKIEQLHRRRNFLASFCKLVIYNILPAKRAAHVFKHYVTFYNDYGDIIKATLGKVRENNKVNCAKTMIHALILKFKEIQEFQRVLCINRQTVEFHAMKELAKRFALSFGLDAVKNREAVAQLHREGILEAVTPLENPEDPSGPPPNVALFEIWAEFTNKLLKQDKKIVLAYLDKRISPALATGSDDWHPLLLYRNSLLHGDCDVNIVPSVPMLSKRPYGRKRKITGSDEDDDE